MPSGHRLSAHPKAKGRESKAKKERRKNQRPFLFKGEPKNRLWAPVWMDFLQSAVLPCLLPPTVASVEITLSPPLPPNTRRSWPDSLTQRSLTFVFSFLSSFLGAVVIRCKDFLLSGVTVRRARPRYSPSDFPRAPKCKIIQQQEKKGKYGGRSKAKKILVKAGDTQEWRRENSLLFLLLLFFFPFFL